MKSLDLDIEFQNLFDELRRSMSESIEYAQHPPEGILKRYVYGQLSQGMLSPEALLRMLRGELAEGEWNSSMVAIHARTCMNCAHRVAQLRHLRQQSD